MATVDVNIPDIGDFKRVPVIEVLVKPGDEVQVDQPLVTLESDKATMDVPSTVAGRVAEVATKPGDKVSMGTLVARIEEIGAKGRAAATSSPSPAASTTLETTPPPSREPPASRAGPTPEPRPLSPDTTDFAGVFAGPAVRRLARELSLDLNRIQGTGEKGRITREDIRSAVARGGAAGGAALPSIPAIDFAQFGPIEAVPLSRIKRLSGPRIHASWLNIPHVTHTDEADITSLEPFRRTLDEEAKKNEAKPYRVSLLSFIMRAAVAALKAFPTFNAALSPTGGALILRHYWHVGVAVDTAEGLVVPVLKDVDRKGVLELARELAALAEKARAGKLSPLDMQGATFTISSLGGIGGTAFTPIIDAPQVAILGVVRSKITPVWDGKAFQPRLMLPLCLSYDHRVIDGAVAARFVLHLAATLEDVRRLIL